MITFVATAFQETVQTYAFIGSLLSQTNPNWQAIIYCNGDNQAIRAIIEQIGDDRVMYAYSEKNTEFWGAYNRIASLQMVDTEYIVQTSIQDYYFPQTVERILEHTDCDFIYFNSINHLTGRNKILVAEPIVASIDWGNFAIKTCIARQVGINYPEHLCGDGKFAEEVFDSGLIKTSQAINEVLTIHN